MGLCKYNGLLFSNVFSLFCFIFLASAQNISPNVLYTGPWSSLNAAVGTTVSLYCHVNRTDAGWPSTENIKEWRWVIRNHQHWERPGENSRIYQRFVSNDSLELVIKDVGRNDEGDYECQIILNEEMTLARTVKLSVHGYINFLSSTKEYKKLYRTAGAITCETDRPLQLSWVKDGRNLTELGPVLWRSKTDADAISGDILYANITRNETHTAIHFTSYGLDHDGYYECHAIDLETGVNDFYRIHAEGQKVPIEKRSLEIVEDDATASIYCLVLGWPLDEIAWLYGPRAAWPNKLTLLGIDAEKHEIHKKVFPDQTLIESQLIIHNVTEVDRLYRYWCRVKSLDSHSFYWIRLANSTATAAEDSDPDLQENLN